MQIKYNNSIKVATIGGTNRNLYYHPLNETRNYTEVEWQILNATNSSYWSWKRSSWKFGPFIRYDICFENGTKISMRDWIPLGEDIFINMTIPKMSFEGNSTLGYVDLYFSASILDLVVRINLYYYENETIHWRVLGSIYNRTSDYMEGKVSLFNLDVSKSEFIEDEKNYYIKFAGSFDLSLPKGIYLCELNVWDNNNNQVIVDSYSASASGYFNKRQIAIGESWDILYNKYPPEHRFRFLKKNMDGEPILNVAKNQPFIFQFNISSEISAIVLTLDIPLLKIKRNVADWHLEPVEYSGGWIWNDSLGTFVYDENATFRVMESVYGLQEEVLHIDNRGFEINTTVWNSVWNSTTGTYEHRLVNYTYVSYYQIFLVYNASKGKFYEYLGYQYIRAVDFNDPTKGNKYYYTYLAKIDECEDVYKIYQLLENESQVIKEKFGYVVNFVGYFTDHMISMDGYMFDFMVYDEKGNVVPLDSLWEFQNVGWEYIKTISVGVPLVKVSIKDSNGEDLKTLDKGGSFIVYAKLIGSSDLINDVDGVKIHLSTNKDFESKNETIQSTFDMLLTIDFINNETYYEAYNRTTKTVWIYGEYRYWDSATGQWKNTTGWHYETYVLNLTSGEWQKGWIPWGSKDLMVDQTYLTVTNYTIQDLGVGERLYIVNVTTSESIPDGDYYYHVYFTNWVYGVDYSKPNGEYDTVAWVKQTVYYFIDQNGEMVYVDTPRPVECVQDSSGNRYIIDARPYIIIGDEKLPLKTWEYYDSNMNLYVKLLQYDYYDPITQSNVYYYELTNGSKIHVYTGYCANIYNVTIPDLGLNILSPSNYLRYDEPTGKSYISLLNGSILQIDGLPNHVASFTNITVDIEFENWVVLLNMSKYLIVKDSNLHWDSEKNKYYIILANDTKLYLDYYEAPYYSYYYRSNNSIYFVSKPMALYNGTFNGTEIQVFDFDKRIFFYTMIGGVKYPLPKPNADIHGEWDLDRTTDQGGAVPVDNYVLYNGSYYLLHYDSNKSIYYITVNGENITFYSRGQYWHTVIGGEGYWLTYIGDKISYGMYDKLYNRFNRSGQLEVIPLEDTGLVYVGEFNGIQEYYVTLLNGTNLYLNYTKFLWIYKLKYNGSTYYVRNKYPINHYTETGVISTFILLNGTTLNTTNMYELTEATLVLIGNNETLNFNGETCNLTEYHWDTDWYYYTNIGGNLYLVDLYGSFSDSGKSKIFNVNINSVTYKIIGDKMWIKKKFSFYGRPVGWHHENIRVAEYKNTSYLIIGTPDYGIWWYRAWKVDPASGALDLDGDLNTTKDRFYVKEAYHGVYYYNTSKVGMVVSILWDPNSTKSYDELHMSSWMGMTKSAWRYTWNQTYYWYYYNNLTLVSKSTMEWIKSIVLQENGLAKPGYWTISTLLKNTSSQDLIAMAQEKGWDWIKEDYQTWTSIWFGFQQDYYTSWSENNTQQSTLVSLKYEYSGLLLYNDTNDNGFIEETELTHYLMPDNIENITFVTPGEQFEIYNNTGKLVLDGEQDITFGITFEGINGTLYPSNNSIWKWHGGEILTDNYFTALNQRPIPTLIDMISLILHFKGNLTQDETGNRQVRIKLDQYIGNWDIGVPAGRGFLENRSLAISYYVSTQMETHWAIFSEDKALTPDDVARASEIKVGFGNVSFAEFILSDKYLSEKDYLTHNLVSQTTPLYTYESLFSGFNSSFSAIGWTFQQKMYFLTIDFPIWDGYGIYQDPTEVLKVGAKSTISPPSPQPPSTTDSDGDGLPDEWEIEHNLNPNDPTDATLDNDNDGLSNLEEYLHGTDPNSADTDGDGFNDGLEVELGTDPLDPNDYPSINRNNGVNYWELVLASITILLVASLGAALLIKKKKKRNS
ncbi:MAG: hypothetical protein ACP6IP_04250 [Candidatus Njordarchaeia archaeon]